MLISCNRLKKYIKNCDDIDFLHIWDKFTIRTAEVEDVKEVGKNFDGIVIAQIKECTEHPDSDHMHILKLDVGESELIQVVCGAPNVKVGLKTACVRVGGHIDGFEITKRPLRGIDSFGMCCSGRELGISDNNEGIIEFPDDAPVGMDVKKYLPIEDIIVEIDNKSLTNRPDLWGHYGIAREICAICDKELLPLDLLEVENKLSDLDIKINVPELCYRYSGITVDNIKNNKTPLDMQIFLYYVGMRSISLIVDLTNFLMLELGQPMHAFDSRVVKNIEVDLAKDGDKFKTLDGEERILNSNNLMIKNKDTYFAIAGVMGGENSEILEDTSSFFLESATFNAGSVRRTAIGLGLRTEASARYEKSLDPNMTDKAIKRLLYLLKNENPDMKITSNLTDVYPTKLDSITIDLEKSVLKTYMGTELPDSLVEKILTSLDFEVETLSDKYVVKVPAFRHSKDINIKEDLIEEIARIYGLENIESEPLKLDLISKEQEDIFNQEYEVKHLLATKYDFNEVNSYLWYDTAFLKELNVNKDGVKLLGKTENNILRDDLSFSLLNIVKENLKNYSKVNIFEIGTIIRNNQNKRVLSIVMADNDTELESVYNKAKEIVLYLFKILKNQDIEINNNVNELSYYDDKLGKIITIDKVKYGEINVLKNSITNKLGRHKVVVTIDIDFDKYVVLDTVKKLAKNISKYPKVELDYTIILNNGCKYSDLKEVLDAFKSNLIIKYQLVGTYNNKYTIKYILGSDNKTLDQNDLQGFKDRFIKHIKDNNLDIQE